MSKIKYVKIVYEDADTDIMKLGSTVNLNGKKYRVVEGVKQKTLSLQSDNVVCQEHEYTLYPVSENDESGAE